MLQRTVKQKNSNVGTITYNTVLQKWMSEISEGNKWQLDLVLIQQGSMTRQEGIWKEDELTDPVTIYPCQTSRS
jgi:hypothetical protein